MDKLARGLVSDVVVALERHRVVSGSGAGAALQASNGATAREWLRHWTGVPAGSALHAKQGVEAMSETSQFGALGQISRSAKDIAAAEAWYRDVLGLPHLYTYGNLAFFDCGGTRLMLSAGESEVVDGYVLYFRVGDIHRAYAELGARGAAQESAPHMIHRHPDGTEEWMAFVKDNEGRPVGLMCQVKPES